MEISFTALSSLIKEYRILANLSQDELAKRAAVTRSVVAHLEQGIRVPTAEAIESLCEVLQIPTARWEAYVTRDLNLRLRFEQAVSDLVGRPLSLHSHTTASTTTAQNKISRLFTENLTDTQAFDAFNSILTFYSARTLARPFFDHYLKAAAFSSVVTLENAVESFQVDALRLYPTFEAAFEKMNSVASIDQTLLPLQPKPDTAYRERSNWDGIEIIPESDLPQLGYVAAETAEREAADRQWLTKFLVDLAGDIQRDGKQAVSRLGPKKLHRVDALLRKFGSSLQHGTMSPLFAPDPDQLLREAAALAPKAEIDLAKIRNTQTIAERNLARYLASDFLDIYVATSMRTTADFISVNRFVRQLFDTSELRPLRLRHFNPTQSWIKDRIAKGLVEALMLRRANLTIYMAQKVDSFGKDSEASVALGQGKPVVVFVPKLRLDEPRLDSDQLGRLDDGALLERAKQEGLIDRESDEVLDRQALLSKLIESFLAAATDETLIATTRRHWADFDLYGESERIEPQLRGSYRSWLDGVISGSTTAVSPELRPGLLRILVATAVNFEKRATLFREVHPLALQVILSTGVLNGIVVVRSVEECATLVSEILRNQLQLKLDTDEHNYRLIEERTASTVRVISRHRLIRNAFTKHYREG